MGVAAKPFGTHQHAAAPHKGRAGADREGDEQRKVVDQCAVCGQAGTSGGQVKGVACSSGEGGVDQPVRSLWEGRVISWPEPWVGPSEASPVAIKSDVSLSSISTRSLTLPGCNCEPG